MKRGSTYKVGAKDATVAKNILIKEKPSTLYRGHLKNQKNPNHCRLKWTQLNILRIKLLGHMLFQGHVGTFILALDHPGTQRILQLWSKGVWLLFKLATDLGIIPLMLLFQTCKIQEL